jgi:hypothetical protein
LSLQPELSATVINAFRQIFMIAAMRTLNGRADPVIPQSGEQQRSR